ncbi:hypothetical protein [Paenibacillus sp. FSL R7-0026]|uniref:hypothetical protein n=1 Tax=Paenibacillus sp. FSL R7-0026 TaxID=2921668 RepID=UPI0030F713DC
MEDRAFIWKASVLYGEYVCGKVNNEAGGGASKCSLVIDLRDKFDEFLREFNVFGSMEKAELHQTIDYVKL